ncbi:72 kDa inositol polyphosphate 5-phosphatase [Daphnia magna]|uniref:72 kDa inositol polyphosphate 5-phosphatase n=1 Tax=Daphnia magna TaxID=35525 RepID=A0A162PUA8_9CRUS|nr:72 kDa inositol polyphosphate 5-phosphatase [Daphnia magna]
MKINNGFLPILTGYYGRSDTPICWNFQSACLLRRNEKTSTSLGS